MAWYTINHCCGHTSEVQLYGPGKNREWRISQMEQELCPECQAAEYARKSAEAAEKAKEMELPQLTGSKKQIAWAETIRMDFVKEYEEEHVNDIINVNVAPRKWENHSVSEYVEDVLKQTSAEWWIDKRGRLWDSFSVRSAMESLADKAAEAAPQATQEEMMLRPDEQTQGDIITITSDDRNVIAQCERRNDNFKNVVSALKYKRDIMENHNIWVLPINATTGSAADRMAELGSKLLAAGFPLYVADSAVRSKIIAGDYEPMYQRWVARDGDMLAIRWEHGNDNIYNAAKSLPAARWDRDLQAIVVSPKYYKRLGDFISAYGFRVTPKAQALMDMWQEQERQALLVKPTVKNAEAKGNGISDVLNSSREVLPELIDDDT